MSKLVLHMDKFKWEAVRGLQSHNQRERKSHSNPDVDYSRSSLNYDLHNAERIDFTEAIDRRVDALKLTRSPRHDAVMLCGLIVSSDQEFFKNLGEARGVNFSPPPRIFSTASPGRTTSSRRWCIWMRQRPISISCMCPLPKTAA